MAGTPKTKAEWYLAAADLADRIAAKLAAGETDWPAVNKQFVGALLKALSTPCGVHCPTFLRFFPREARDDGQYPAAMAERYAASARKLRREAAQAAG
jgi:hypothetical protein